MRIAVNAWFTDRLTTGSGQYLAALAEWLPLVGPQNEYVLVGWAGGQSGRSSPVATAVATPFDRISEDLAKVWFEQVAFPAACHRLRADLGFVPYWGSPWWRPCPMVVTVHDLIPLLLPAYRGGPLQRVYTALVSRTAMRAAAVLADSESSRRDIIAHLGIAPERVHSVYLSADGRYRREVGEPERERVRSRYRLPAGPFLLYLGGFDVRKNLPRTLEAYGAMARHMDEGQRGGHAAAMPPLVIAGELPADDSPFAPDPRPIISRLGLGDRVCLLGRVDEADKPALYSLATATVFASEYEGFGLPVLEAMACHGEHEARS